MRGYNITCIFKGKAFISSPHMSFCFLLFIYFFWVISSSCMCTYTHFGIKVNFGYAIYFGILICEVIITNKRNVKKKALVITVEVIYFLII